MTRTQFIAIYYDINAGRNWAVRQALRQGVRYAQIQMWVLQLEKGIHHLVVN